MVILRYKSYKTEPSLIPLKIFSEENKLYITWNIPNSIRNLNTQKFDLSNKIKLFY